MWIVQLFLPFVDLLKFLQMVFFISNLLNMYQKIGKKGTK